MSFDFFLRIVAAVIVGNIMTFILVYGVWRATKAEKQLGVTNGADVIPLPLLLAMLAPFGLCFWAIYSLH